MTAEIEIVKYCFVLHSIQVRSFFLMFFGFFFKFCFVVVTVQIYNFPSIGDFRCDTDRVQTDDFGMEEEKKTTETEQATDAIEGSRKKLSGKSPLKRRRGRPQGSKKLRVCVADVSDLIAEISNGGATQLQRKRARPRLSETQQSEETSNGSTNHDNEVGVLITGHSPKKRGRPTKSKISAEDLRNGSSLPKLGRGRSKGYTKRKVESLSDNEAIEGSSVTQRKRGRPKSSLNIKPKLELSSTGEKEGTRMSARSGRGRPRKVLNSDDDITVEAHKGRGRPRKMIAQESVAVVTDGNESEKRGRGRPKGSFKKKCYLLEEQRKRPGRPRKYPPPPPEERNKPKVWKPLGRPKKYPPVNSEGSHTAAPKRQRKRGRPRKSEYGKGAHLRKKVIAAPSKSNDGIPRKRGRPPGTKIPQVKKDGPKRERGRPKGSRNKSKILGKLQLDSKTCNHVKGDSSETGYCETTEEEPAVGHTSGAEEMSGEVTSPEVSDHA